MALAKQPASRIMPRTTINSDAPVLEELKAIQKKQGASLGTVTSRLLAEAIARQRKPPRATRVHGVSKPMGCRNGLADKEALPQLLDEDS